MKYKKIMVLAIFLVSLLAISAVSAADNVTSDVVSVENNNKTVGASENQIIIDGRNDNTFAVEEQDVEDVCATDENELSESVGTFTNLANEISNADGELNLSRDYVYSSSDSKYQKGIIIYNNITIDGNGYKIDGNNQARSFVVYQGCTLKNIIFINCCLSSSSNSIYTEGGAIYLKYGNNLLVNCTFINCYANANGEYSFVHGGAIYFEECNCSLINCNFKDCFVFASLQKYGLHSWGGAICGIGNNEILISNCSFVNCFANTSHKYVASVHGGAISLHGIQAVVRECDFINCSTSSPQNFDSKGGAIYWTGTDGYLVNCNFVDCFALPSYSDTPSSAVYWNGSRGHLINCISNDKLVNGDGYTVSYESLVKLSMVNEINYGETAILNTSVSNGATGTIKVLVDGIYKTSSIVGETIVLSDLNAGEHTIMVIYDGDNHYNSCMNISVLKVNSVPSNIYSNTMTTVYNGGLYLVAFLTDNEGNPLPGQTLYSDLNGMKISTTDFNGQVKLSTNNLAPKTYAVTITFMGDNTYYGTSTTVKLTVKKATPKLTAKAKTFKKSVKTKNYVVTLKTNQNKVMKNTKVTLKVNGKTYTAKTNTKGQATFKITKLTKKGTFTATIKYAGSKYYNAKTVKAKITVK